MDLSFLVAQWETSGGGLARVMSEQAEKLIEECETAGEDPAAFAHKARVRAKKIRAALRLAAPLLGKKGYAKENRRWRNASRELSGIRDLSARIKSLEALTPFLTERIGAVLTKKLSDRFKRQRREADSDADEAILAFCRRIARRRKALTPDLDPGAREDMAQAVVDTYGRARNAMKRALKERDPFLLHEWRKQTKYHALHARLMRLTFPETLEDRTSAARKLSDLLGDINDIEVVLKGAKDWAEAPEGFRPALKERRKQLIAEAEHAGRKLFSEKPKAFHARLLDPPMPVERLALPPEEVLA